MRLPVLVGDSGGAPETVVDGVTGRVLPGDDPAAWTRAVLALLRDPAAAAAMGERGRQHVEERFGPGRPGGRSGPHCACPPIP